MIRIRKIHWHYLNHLGSSSCVFWECNLCVLPLKHNPCPALPFLSVLLYRFFCFPLHQFVCTDKKDPSPRILGHFFSHLIADKDKYQPTYNYFWISFGNYSLRILENLSHTWKLWFFNQCFLWAHYYVYIHIFYLYFNFIFLEIYIFQNLWFWEFSNLESLCEFIETLRNLSGLP